jgi:hypothetical protein
MCKVSLLKALHWQPQARVQASAIMFFYIAWERHDINLHISLSSKTLTWSTLRTNFLVLYTQIRDSFMLLIIIVEICDIRLALINTVSCRDSSEVSIEFKFERWIPYTKKWCEYQYVKTHTNKQTNNTVNS